MKAIEGLLKIDKELSVSVYLQVTNGIIAYIRQGTIKPGAVLPPSRMLAKALNIHRKTVVAAYDELYAQSWVDVYPRKGIFVAKNLPDISPKPITKAIEINSFADTTYFNVNDHRVPYAHSFTPGPEQNIVFNDGFPDTRIAPVDLLVREYRRFSN